MYNYKDIKDEDNCLNCINSISLDGMNGDALVCDISKDEVPEDDWCRSFSTGSSNGKARFQPNVKTE